MRTLRLTMVTALLMGVVPSLTGCAFFQEAHSTMVTGPDGLRTFTLAPRGDNVMCAAFASVDPLGGVLRAEPPGSREPVRLVVPDGYRVSVVWPEGFTVTLEPDAVLRNQQGDVVARDGAFVTLDQTPRSEATGPWDDPYIAHGLVLGGCYPYAP